jgi:hypothetical protein
MHVHGLDKSAEGFMAKALIQQDQSPGSPALQKRRNGWVVAFETSRAQRPDPLTGWAGGAETQSQVNLRFPTAEAAIAYCEREGHDFKVIPAPRRKLLLQSYADNFR